MKSKNGKHIPKRFRRFNKNLHSDYLDIIVSSGEIKKLIIQRAKDLKVNIYALAEEAGIQYQSFRDLYLNKHDVRCSPALRQDHIIELARLLGIDLRVTVIVRPAEELDVEHLRSLRNHLRHYDKKKYLEENDEDQGTTE